MGILGKTQLFHFVDDPVIPPSHWHQWSLPSHGLKIEAIDAHVCGQPLRLIVRGYPAPRGVTMIEKCSYAMTHLDHLRGSLLLEPRGHADMYACLLTPPQRVDSDFGSLFLHRSGVCPMSAHGVIAAATLCIEAGIVSARSPETLVKFDTPAGLIRAYASIEESRVRRVYFENVPSFVVAQMQEIIVPELGRVTYDVAYGGEFYAYVDARKLNIALTPENMNEIAALGTTIASALESRCQVSHPIHPALSILSGVIFSEEIPRRRDVVANIRQVCVFTDGSLDRSPSGTALSGRLALMHARHEVDMGQPWIAEGILGGTLTGKTVREGIALGDYPAIITEIQGSAQLTGIHSFFIDPEDRLKEGFLI